MTIQISCDNCQTIMRVEDQHAGKQARCPNCSELVAIPLTNEGDNSPTNPYSSATSLPPSNPYASPTSPTNKSYAPHRGPAILVLGISSIMCCAFLGIPAIIMANNDLDKMNHGEMDPEGRGMTQSGKIIGIVGLVTAAIGFLVGMLGFGFGITAGP